MEQWNANTMQVKIAGIFPQHSNLIHYKVISFSFSNSNLPFKSFLPCRSMKVAAITYLAGCSTSDAKWSRSSLGSSSMLDAHSLSWDNILCHPWDLITLSHSNTVWSIQSHFSKPRNKEASKRHTCHIFMERDLSVLIFPESSLTVAASYFCGNSLVSLMS